MRLATASGRASTEVVMGLCAIDWKLRVALPIYLIALHISYGEKKIALLLAECQSGFYSV